MLILLQVSFSFSARLSIDVRTDTHALFLGFSYKAVCDFLDRNNLLSVIRAHEAQDQGVSIAQSSIRLILHR